MGDGEFWGEPRYGREMKTPVNPLPIPGQQLMGLPFCFSALGVRGRGRGIIRNSRKGLIIGNSKRKSPTRTFWDIRAAPQRIPARVVNS